MSILAHTATEPAHNPQKSSPPFNAAPPPPIAPIMAAESRGKPPDQPYPGRPSQRPSDSRSSRNKGEFSQAQIDDVLNKHFEMSMLRSYDPWGRPGNGAPVADNHKRKFTEQDLKEDLKPGNIGGIQFYTPGGGAPLRTPSGHVRADISGSEDIRHQGVARGRDPVETFRYRKDPETIAQYRADLEKIRREQAAVQEQQRHNDLKTELASLRYDAFGRPGAGAPNAMTNYGSMNASKPKDTTLGMGPMRGHGAPLENEMTGERKTKLLTTLDTKDGDRLIREVPGAPPRGSSDNSDNVFLPFGSPGGGNPNYDKAGNRIPYIQGCSTVMRDAEEEQRKALAAQEYSRELQQGMLERELSKRKEKQTMRSPTENLADKMHVGQVGYPRRNQNTGQLIGQHRGSSDVTCHSNISPRNANASLLSSETYYTDLERQCEARKARMRVEKDLDMFEAKQHHDNFYRNFGKSAPGDNLKRQNLLKNLHHPDTEKNEYKKLVVDSAPKYVKNNTGSYHATAYEIPDRNPYRVNYCVRPPYASHTE